MWKYNSRKLPYANIYSFLSKSWIRFPKINNLLECHLFAPLLEFFEHIVARHTNRSCCANFILSRFCIASQIDAVQRMRLRSLHAEGRHGEELVWRDVVVILESISELLVCTLNPGRNPNECEDSEGRICRKLSVMLTQLNVCILQQLLSIQDSAPRKGKHLQGHG